MLLLPWKGLGQNDSTQSCNVDLAHPRMNNLLKYWLKMSD